MRDSNTAAIMQAILPIKKEKKVEGKNPVGYAAWLQAKQPAIFQVACTWALLTQEDGDEVALWVERGCCGSVPPVDSGGCYRTGNPPGLRLFGVWVVGVSPNLWS